MRDDLKTGLEKLGKAHPDLRQHIRPLLATATRGAALHLPMEGQFVRRGKDYMYVQAVSSPMEGYPTGWVDYVGTLTKVENNDPTGAQSAGGGMDGSQWARSGWKVIPTSAIPNLWKEWFKAQLRDEHLHLAGTQHAAAPTVNPALSTLGDYMDAFLKVVADVYSTHVCGRASTPLSPESDQVAIPAGGVFIYGIPAETPLEMTFQLNLAGMLEISVSPIQVGAWAKAKTIKISLIKLFSRKPQAIGTALVSKIRI